MLQLATLMLPEEENFLLLFRRETPLDNSVEFMRVRSKVVKHWPTSVQPVEAHPAAVEAALTLCFVQIWRSYDTDSSGYISAVELKVILNTPGFTLFRHI